MSAELSLIKGENKPNPVFRIESRPPTDLRPYLSFWAVLSYKEHVFERMLPPDFMALDESEQNFIALGAAGELKRDLKPILDREDGTIVIVGG